MTAKILVRAGASILPVVVLMMLALDGNSSRTSRSVAAVGASVGQSDEELTPEQSRKAELAAGQAAASSSDASATTIAVPGERLPDVPWADRQGNVDESIPNLVTVVGPDGRLLLGPDGLPLQVDMRQIRRGEGLPPELASLEREESIAVRADAYGEALEITVGDYVVLGTRGPRTGH